MNEGKLKETVQPGEKNANLSNDYNKVSRNNNVSYKQGYTFKSRTCSYFYEHGYCKFGSNCKYKHYKTGNESNKYDSRGKNQMMSKNMCKDKKIGNKDMLQSINTQTPRKQICHYFKAGNCLKENNCDYQHSIDYCSNEMSYLTLQSTYQKIPRKMYFASNRPLEKRTTPLCYYFKKGMCYKGENCKYYHQNKDSSNTTIAQVPLISTEEKDGELFLQSKIENANLASEDATENKSTAIFNKTLNVYDLISLSIEEISELRYTEIRQLKKRFPCFGVITENQTFSIMFQPSDPDWAFDVKHLKLDVDFPEKYPTEKCKITVIQNVENIPQLLIKYLNKAICEWVDKKFEENSTSSKAELMFRPFLKWFDKNLEELFITGLRQVKQDLKAKEDGIEFVPVENLFSSSEKIISEDIRDKNNSVYTSQLLEQTVVSEYKISQPLINQSNKLSPYLGNDGMKIIFSELELIEGAAAFICTKLSATLQCCRCKTPFNMQSAPGKNNSYVCLKCSKNVGFTFDPSTVHQFSSVVGVLHLLECVAVDINLVECHFLIDCLNCSKQVAVDGVHYGQKHKMWCTFCNEKMLISIGCVKFQALKLASVPDTKYIPAKRIEKKPKDPVVKEGEPLPNFGACKHYKKSYRWLRFPCCGRLYPCDECHNEKETDHEMKYASRMICGFCAKEQPYSREKPCLLCSQSLTKKSGSHWEGGKGCRNKIQMCREDKQKYSGICKTISKKAQSAKPKKKH